MGVGECLPCRGSRNRLTEVERNQRAGRALCGLPGTVPPANVGAAGAGLSAPAGGLTIARMPPPAPAEPFDFPNPELADDDGLLALGVPVLPVHLRAAYARGIFPWPVSLRQPVPWVSPGQRAVLEFDRLNVPKTLRQARQRASWLFTIDRAFAAVITACAAARRPGQRGTWITPAMIAGYTAFHREGGAHSVEVWDGERLVGGLYGIDAGGLFTGESMFHLEPNASKLALLHLIDHLAGRGATWLDIQQLTPHFAVLGAREIPRREFLARLKAEQAEGRKLFG